MASKTIRYRPTKERITTGRKPPKPGTGTYTTPARYRVRRKMAKA